MIPDYFKADRHLLETMSRNTVSPRDTDREGVKQITALTKYEMFVYEKDKSVGQNLLHDGFWEIWITQFMCDFIKPGWHCFDIGSNYGYYSLLMADLVGEQTEVWAFEPQTELTLMLEVAAFVNKFTNIRTVPIALSDVNEFVSLSVSESFVGDASIAYGLKNEDRVDLVQAHTFDYFFGDSPRPVDFVKIDVEGSEQAVLRGMKYTLDNNPDIAILMEWFTPRIHEPERFLTSLRQRGFKIYVISTEGKTVEVLDDQLIETPGVVMVLLRR